MTDDLECQARACRDFDDIKELCIAMATVIDSSGVNNGIDFSDIEETIDDLKNLIDEHKNLIDEHDDIIQRIYEVIR